MFTFYLKNISDNLDENNIDLDLIMSHFVSQITHNQRQLSIDVINYVIKKEGKSKCSSCPSCKYYPNTNTKIIFETNVRTTSKMIRKGYLKGRCSMNGNLPILAMNQLDNHTYISQIDVIFDLLQHELPLNKIKRNKSRILISVKSHSISTSF